MDFNYSLEEEKFRQEVHSWLEVNLPNDLREGRDEELPQDERWKRHRAWHKKLYEGGWVGIGWPKEYGGRGASLIEQTIINEELARTGAPPGVNMNGIALLGPTLMHWGTEEQKKRFLPKILPAEEIWCQGYSEPGSGSDLASLQTKAVEDGDYFVVNGQKVWTSQAQYADWCFLLVRTDPNAPKHEGISYLLVDMHSPGITVQPLKQMTGEAEFNQMFFEDVHVPRENLLGPLNGGWGVAITTLMNERATLSLATVMRFRNVFKDLSELARRVMRDGSCTIDPRVIRQTLAQFYVDVQSMKY